MNHLVLSAKLKEYIVSVAKKFEPMQNVPQPECWKMLRKCGTRLWLDTGDMAVASRLWCKDFDALTTNNTLLNQEVQKGIYDELIRTTSAKIKTEMANVSLADMIQVVAFTLNAVHGLNLARQFNCKVSVELHTDLAFDADHSYATGRSLWAICPERFIIKVPMTPAGLLAARRLQNDGIPVNLTLGFSARQNYLAALFAGTAYVNVFMGRLNAFISNNQLGDGVNIGEKATLSTQRQLTALRLAGCSRSLLIGASMRDAGQVVSLCGLDVMTMPPKVAESFMKTSPQDLSLQINNEPAVVCPYAFMKKLWEVPAEFKKLTADFVSQECSGMTAEMVTAYFRRHGYGDLFPEWSSEQIGTLLDDGKIPVYETWRHQLEVGSVGIDALMNMSALYSFISDQRALDCRIREILNHPE